MVEIDKFNDELRANGQWIFAWGLQAPETATVIDNRGGANLSTKWPNSWVEIPFTRNTQFKSVKCFEIMALKHKSLCSGL